MKDYINIFYCISNNFGDAINPIIAELIFKKPIVWTQTSDEIKHLILCGSILNHANQNSTVIGAGLAQAGDVVNRHVNILAVRGKITEDIIRNKFGYKQPVGLGDPVLLLPRILELPRPEKKYKVGIIPHYVDQAVLYELYHKRLTENGNFFKLINSLESSPIKMINDALSCEKIITSSLHGLVLGFAYDIPTQWCKITNKIIGGNMKFLDFYSSIDATDVKAPRAISDIMPMTNEEIFAHIGETRYTEKITTIQNNLLAIFETLKK